MVLNRGCSLLFVQLVATLMCAWRFKSWAFCVIKLNSRRLECFAQGVERVGARCMPFSLNVADGARVYSRTLCQISHRPAKQFSRCIYMFRFSFVENAEALGQLQW